MTDDPFHNDASSQKDLLPNEHSAGFVLFRDAGRKREYLLLHYPGGHFDFAKGHIERGETEKDAAVRELKEETGIDDIEWVDGYREKIDYLFRRHGQMRYKDVIFFLAKTRQKKINLSTEHQGSMWLPYPTAYEKLTFENAKNLLRVAEEHLNHINKKHEN